MDNAYTLSKEKLLKVLNTSEKGLKDQQVKENRQKYGRNVLKDQGQKSKLTIFLNQFKNIMVILLLVVGILSLIYAIVSKQDFLEPIVILGTSLLNCFMGYFQESKAEDAIGKLKKYSNSFSTVKRNGVFQRINSKNIVVGDYLVLEAGDKIPADARIIESFFAKCDESILTGESLSVEKNVDKLPENVSVSEKSNMVFSGTILVAGKVKAIVTNVGMKTELGKIAESLVGNEEIMTPLQFKIKRVSSMISFLAAILVALVLGYGLIKDYSLLNVIMLCISMIVASVPECLPVAITATLSIGVSQMAKKKSLVRNLAAIETLGAVEVICTDKTGTLTKNKMEVIELFCDLKKINQKNIINYPEFINAINLCNDVHKDKNGKYSGDSVEIALKNYLNTIDLKCLISEKNKLIELPFDSNRKMMSVVYTVNNQRVIYSKGSLEAIINKCKYILADGKIKKINSKLIDKVFYEEANMSKKALKVIAITYKVINKDVINNNDYYNEEKDLVFLGLIGLKDPARNEVKESISDCLSAHIRPVMITGDNLETALAIGKEVGICHHDDDGINASILTDMKEKEIKSCVSKYSVFARVSPENKVQIVKAFQNSGKVVAMSGDGVNDAPALKLANVGIGMGKSGTDVTKSVADIILLDDSYATITTAIKEGRRIYDNVITNILYNLSSNFTEILIILIGMFTGNTIISALHILYIDLVADTIPSIALAFEQASKKVMHNKPHGLNKPIFTKFFTMFLIVSVILETSISLFVYYNFLKFGKDIAQTLALLSIIINEFVFAYNCRSLKEQIHERGLLSNKYLNISILFLFSIQIIVFFTPIGKLFGLQIVTLAEFVYVIIINVISFLILELIKPLIYKFFADK